MSNIKKPVELTDDSTSDDDEDSSEDEGDCPGPGANSSHRGKRGLQWCAVDTDTYHHGHRNRKRPHQNHPHQNHPHQNHPHQIHPHQNRPHYPTHPLNHDPRRHPPKKVVWPPPSNATPSTSTSNQWRYDNVREGNPKLGAKMQLYCQTGHHLAVYPDGEVRGTPDENDLHTYLELSSAGYPGHVRIKALLTNLYVGMDRRGRLYGEYRIDTSKEYDPMMEATVFIESFQGLYTTYLSRRYAHLGWYIGIKRNGKIKRGPLTGLGQKAIKFVPRRGRFENH